MYLLVIVCSADLNRWRPALWWWRSPATRTRSTAAVLTIPTAILACLMLWVLHSASSVRKHQAYIDPSPSVNHCAYIWTPIEFKTTLTYNWTVFLFPCIANNTVDQVLSWCSSLMNTKLFFRPLFRTITMAHGPHLHHQPPLLPPCWSDKEREVCLFQGARMKHPVAPHSALQRMAATALTSPGASVGSPTMTATWSAVISAGDFQWGLAEDASTDHQRLLLTFSLVVSPLVPGNI